MPQNLVTWVSGKEYVDYDYSNYDFSQETFTPADDEYYYSDYDYSSGITGGNVLIEQMKPTRPSFITGQNVIG